MLRDYLNNNPTELLTTYTRNPRVLRMIGSVANSVYPIDDAPDLQRLATLMSHVSMRQDVGYHINRYAKGGLFRGDDPANSTVATSPRSLKQQYPVLKNVRNALAVVARIEPERN